jgi:hypothetical protein
MDNKVVIFSYKRDSLPHSEFQVRKQLEKFLAEDSNSFVITTSTASILDIVRVFCLKNKLKLTAFYEEEKIPFNKKMRLNDWTKYPDFTASNDDLEELIDIGLSEE